ncbi:hypothetical protein GCM10009122_31190 [Fulvivirga kasyanovii]|uniref:Metallophosphoesterase family protein n=1 Tax=Fulvivirga kasyanovii TaxID=396812 RepID=A0ABW9RT26_9BACT|nr:metallophosphoesterase family protein [Fulvivirga kasyanovii]MTI26448.1 metallophosphoesterase family protein [Fulvivirga kasyanovii]
MKQIINTIIFIPLILLIYCTTPTSEIKPLLARKPYLQCALKDSLTILWRTDTGTVCKVAYKPATHGEWKSVEGNVRLTNTGVTENEVVLRNLEPNTSYRYKILTNDVNLLPDDTLWFRSPVSQKDSVFSFFAVGDIGEPIEEGGTPDRLAKALEPSVSTMNFGLLLGDIIYPDGKSEAYDSNLFRYFDGVFPYLPVFTLLGNHDWHEPENNYLQEWKLPNNEHYYSFDYAQVHFIGLDSKNGDFHEYEKQVEWLKNDLEAARGKANWIIVFLHHNGKSCTYKEDYANVVALYPLFEQYDVDLVLNGHAHTYERLNPMNGLGEVIPEYIGSNQDYRAPQGFISITVGSGGKLRGIGSDPKPFTPDPENCRHKDLVAHADHLWAFLKISVNGKQLKGQSYATEDLHLIDEFMIQK